MSLWALLRAAEGTLSAPAVDTAACSRRHGTDCSLCHDACPVDAISVEPGQAAVVAAQACVGCGICVATCPTQAVSGAGPTAGAVVDQTVTSAAPGVRCEIARLLGAGAGHVDVPCLAGVHPETVAAAAVRQARSGSPMPTDRADQDCRFELLTGPCPRCPLGGGTAVDRVVSTAQALVAGTGAAVSRRVVDEHLSPDDTVPGRADRARPSPTPHRPRRRMSRRGLLGLALPQTTVPPAGPATPTDRPAERPGVTGPRRVWLAATERPRLPILQVGQGCTACGGCASICPTDAITGERDGSHWQLHFDPDRCVACGECVRTCPEQVLRLGEPAPGTQGVIAEIAVRHCIDCGATLQAAERRRCHRCQVNVDLAADIWAHLDG